MEGYISTREAARLLGIRSQSLRSALCLNGHYRGVRPIKLPNRILRWPADAVESLLAGRPIK